MSTNEKIVIETTKAGIGEALDAARIDHKTTYTHILSAQAAAEYLIDLADYKGIGRPQGLTTPVIPEILLEIEQIYKTQHFLGTPQFMLRYLDGNDDRMFNGEHGIFKNLTAMAELRKPENKVAFHTLMRFALKLGSTHAQEIAKDPEFFEMRNKAFLNRLKDAWQKKDSALFIELMQSAQFADYADYLIANPLPENAFNIFVVMGNAVQCTFANRRDDLNLLPAFFPNPNFDRLLEQPTVNDQDPEAFLYWALEGLQGTLNMTLENTDIPSICKTVIPTMQQSPVAAKLLASKTVAIKVAAIEDKFLQKDLEKSTGDLFAAASLQDRENFFATLNDAKYVAAVTSVLARANNTATETLLIRDFERLLVSPAPAQEWLVHHWLEDFVHASAFSAICATGKIDGTLSELLKSLLNYKLSPSKDRDEKTAGQFFSNSAVHTRFIENKKLWDQVGEYGLIGIFNATASKLDAEEPATGLAQTSAESVQPVATVVKA